ncbi:SKP1-like protein 4 [Cryptomeria japonica]|uniref:SKP1-like protein 4 n=1 Tax=Cryptomeria japonica TaxID=3369 RepID=UPI0027DA420C|nr:SKP1-like protein 4 [Cryptomeria japonica]
MAEQQEVILCTSDDMEFHVEYEEALQMEYVKSLIEDPDNDRSLLLKILVEKTTGPILEKVFEYIRYHLEANKSNRPEEEVKNWDTQFVNVDQQILFHLLIAADFLNISNLLDLLLKTVADMMKDLSPKQIRELFGITNDFTPEEEAQIRREIEWAFD